MGLTAGPMQPDELHGCKVPNGRSDLRQPNVSVCTPEGAC